MKLCVRKLKCKKESKPSAESDEESFCCVYRFSPAETISRLKEGVVSRNTAKSHPQYTLHTVCAKPELYAVVTLSQRAQTISLKQNTN